LSKYAGEFQASRPVTDYYKETQLANIHPIMRFLSYLVNGDEEPVEIGAKKLYEAYQSFHVAGNYRFIVSEASFGREVKRIGGVLAKRITSGMIYQLDKKEMKLYLKETNRYDPDA